MTDSPLLAGRDALVTAISALTPRGSDPKAYHYLGKARSLGDGTSGHRQFWFRYQSTVDEQDFGDALSIVEHTLELVVRLSTAGWPPMQAFDQFVNEGIALSRLINSRSWDDVAGVDRIWSTGHALRMTDSDDVELVLSLRARTRET